MAMIDWGALLRVDGKFVNRGDDLFMDASDTGYVCEKAFDADGRPCVIDGNYFVYAGDADLLLCFYKQVIVVVSGDKVERTIYGCPFSSETITSIPSLTALNVAHTEPNFITEQMFPTESYEDWLEERYTLEHCKHLYNNYKSKQFKKYLRHVKYMKNWTCKQRTNRYIATWEHGGHKYEVLYGYGIDPSEETWECIKNDRYDFTDTEREIIDSWFSGD